MDGPVISKLVLPNSVKIIEDEAFSGMDVPEGVTIEIGSGIQKIGQSAFDCAVKSLTIHRKKTLYLMALMVGQMLLMNGITLLGMEVVQKIHKRYGMVWHNVCKYNI